MEALTITDANFKEKVLDIKDKPVLVDFWAPWCGPCQMQGPIIDELASEIGDKAVIGKVNVDDSQEAAGKYGIMSIPALIIFKDGEAVENMVGVHHKDDLLKIIAKHS
ncbi:thioredoxin [Patescibacteria group bacterium]|nr:thioredoxin [Patescibacteria group bacterium]MBU1016134.1 thioredoxin [Patescibacteria group bacterium]MBU1684877.1 thioredoxin [Patescibacteria group bacterium]MBU1938593.1 thioredoxin [Patescibacteria group bacterium]